MKQREKIGFVYKLASLEASNVFAQVIAWDEKMGPLIRVSKCELEKYPSYRELVNGALFPPVFVGLAAALKAKAWILVSKIAMDPEAMPIFKATNQSPPDLDDASWYLEEEGKSRFVGRLSEEQKRLETYQIWGHKILEERILESIRRGVR